MSESVYTNSLHTHLKRARRKRLMLILTALVMLATAVSLILYNIRGSISLYRLPSEISAADLAARHLQLGGFVEKGTVRRENGTEVIFRVTDFRQSREVRFNGVLPDLFREGQGVIVEGGFDRQGVFIGTRVLAKHDEKYISKDVADRLKKEGLWEEYLSRGR